MPRTATLSPDALAQARADVDLTGTHAAPDIPRIRNAWAALKAARGQQVNAARLSPSHLIVPLANQQPDHPATMAEVLDRALPGTIRAIRRLGLTARSDFGGAA